MGMTYREKLAELIKLNRETEEICRKQAENYLGQADCYKRIAESYERELAILEADSEP